jgi:hypothetical protein
MTTVSLTGGPLGGTTMDVPEPWPRAQIVTEDGAIYRVTEGTTTAVYVVEETLPEYDDPFNNGGIGTVAEGPQGPEGPEGPAGADGEPGPELFWTGEWSALSTYGKWDAVTWEGGVYVAAHGSIGAGVEPPGTVGTWEPWPVGGSGGGGVSWQGTWDGATTYAEGDLVEYGGTVYLALNPITGYVETPPATTGMNTSDTSLATAPVVPPSTPVVGTFARKFYDSFYGEYLYCHVTTPGTASVSISGTVSPNSNGIGVYFRRSASSASGGSAGAYLNSGNPIAGYGDGGSPGSPHNVTFPVAGEYWILVREFYFGDNPTSGSYTLTVTPGTAVMLAGATAPDADTTNWQSLGGGGGGGTPSYQGLGWLPSVRAASMTNVSTSAPGATIDGQTMTAGDRVLLAGQTTASENGLWVWHGSAAALTRAADDPQAEGYSVLVLGGSGALFRAQVFRSTSTSVWQGTMNLPGAGNTSGWIQWLGMTVIARLYSDVAKMLLSHEAGVWLTSGSGFTKTLKFDSSGNLDFTSATRIIGLTGPTNPADAATKAYVDSAAGGAAAASIPAVLFNEKFVDLSAYTNPDPSGSSGWGSQGPNTNPTVSAGTLVAGTTSTTGAHKRVRSGITGTDFLTSIRVRNPTAFLSGQVWITRLVFKYLDTNNFLFIEFYENGGGTKQGDITKCDAGSFTQLDAGSGSATAFNAGQDYWLWAMMIGNRIFGGISVQDPHVMGPQHLINWTGTNSQRDPIITLSAGNATKYGSGVAGSFGWMLHGFSNGSGYWAQHRAVSLVPGA